LSDNAIAWLSSKGYTTITNSGQTSGIRTKATTNSSDTASVITAGKKAVNINGSSHADSIIGSPYGDTITGGGGNDSIDAGAGNDTIVFTGNDTVFTIGDVHTIGGITDTIIAFSSVLTATIDGGDGKDTLKIIGDATLSSDSNLINIESINITTGGNVSLANQSEDFIITATDNSVHTIVGGLGNDSMTGGSGVDTFSFIPTGSIIGTTLDTITNYVSDTDILQFINANGAAISIALPNVDTSATVAGTNVQINSVGLITFNSADSTYSKKVTAIQADEGLNAAGQVALFTSGADSYVYYSGASTSDSDDQIIKLAKTVGTGLGLGAQGAITSINALTGYNIPIFTHAQINGNNLIISYINKILNTTTPKEAFNLTFNDANDPITAISINEELKTLTLTLTNPINLGETDWVALQYLNSLNGNLISDTQFLSKLINIFDSQGNIYLRSLDTTGLTGKIDSATGWNVYTVNTSGTVNIDPVTLVPSNIESTYYLNDSKALIRSNIVMTYAYTDSQSLLHSSENEDIFTYNASGDPLTHAIINTMISYDSLGNISNSFKNSLTFDTNGQIVNNSFIQIIYNPTGKKQFSSFNSFDLHWHLVSGGNTNYDSNGNKIGSSTFTVTSATYDANGRELTSNKSTIQLDSNDIKIGSNSSESISVYDNINGNLLNNQQTSIQFNVNNIKTGSSIDEVIYSYDENGNQSSKQTHTQFNANGNKLHTSIFEYGVNGNFISHSEIDGIKIIKYDQSNNIIGTYIDISSLTGIFDPSTGLTEYTINYSNNNSSTSYYCDNNNQLIKYTTTASHSNYDVSGHEVGLSISTLVFDATGKMTEQLETDITLDSITGMKNGYTEFIGTPVYSTNLPNLTIGMDATYTHFDSSGIQIGFETETRNFYFDNQNRQVGGLLKHINTDKSSFEINDSYHFDNNGILIGNDASWKYFDSDHKQTSSSTNKVDYVFDSNGKIIFYYEYDQHFNALGNLDSSTIYSRDANSIEIYAASSTPLTNVFVGNAYINDKLTVNLIDATKADFIFHIYKGDSNYTFNITGFDNGDKLRFENYQSTPTIVNSSTSDGIIDVICDTTTIHLTDISTDKDASITDFDSFLKAISLVPTPTPTPNVRVYLTSGDSIFNSDIGGSTDILFDFNITETYEVTIINFSAGDVLNFPSIASLTIINSNAADGIVDVQSEYNGESAIVHLIGLTAAQDSAIDSVNSFNTVFGNGSIR
jgi:hypothetical protein